MTTYPWPEPVWSEWQPVPVLWGDQSPNQKARSAWLLAVWFGDERQPEHVPPAGAMPVF